MKKKKRVSKRNRDNKSDKNIIEKKIKVAEYEAELEFVEALINSIEEKEEPEELAKSEEIKDSEEKKIEESKEESDEEKTEESKEASVVEETEESKETSEEKKIEESKEESEEEKTEESEEVSEEEESEELEEVSEEEESEESEEDETEESFEEEELEESKEKVEEELEENIDEIVDQEVAKDLGILSKEEKKKKRKKTFKIILVLFIILSAILGGLYTAGAYYFETHYYFNTRINGINVDFMEAKDAHELIRNVVSEYQIELIISEDHKEYISADAVELEYVVSEKIDKLLVKQNMWKWPLMILEDSVLEFDIDVDFSIENLEDVLNEFEFMNPEEEIKSINAYPKYVDGEVIIIEEVYGNQMREELIDEISETMLVLDNVYDFIENEVFIEPEYTSESEIVIEAQEEMDSYIRSTISYNEGTKLDSDTIAKWIKVNKSTFKVTVDEDKIKEYVKDLASEYSTVGAKRSFTNPVGKKVTVSGGSYGWTVNQTEEAATILENIKTGKRTSRDIVYSKKAASYGKTDWGNTYAMIDITKQEMYMVYKGELVLTSDVVTGSIAAGTTTPQGVYSLSYKTKDAVLRGAYLPDGTREYESPVDYWMPFNGGIGFHDASWRSTFGGTIYKTNGSHGCVNMPNANAAKLYQYIEAGTPVICHY